MKLLAAFVIQWICYFSFLAWLQAFVVRRFRKSTARDQDVSAFLLSGFIGYATFFVYFVSYPLGWIVSISIAAISLTNFIRHYKRRSELGAIFKDEDSLWVLGAGLFYYATLILGRLGSRLVPSPDFIQQAISQFRAAIADVFIPRIVAENWRQGLHPVEVTAGWLVSDRPPLQSGLYLAYSFFADTAWYWTFASLLQLLALFWLSKFLRVQKFPDRVRRRVLLLLVVSTFFGFNVMGPWPKLLATAFFLVAMVAIQNVRREPWRWELAAAAMSLAALSHSGVLLAAPLFAAFVVRELRRSTRNSPPVFHPTAIPHFVCAAVIGFVVLLPWQLFVKLFAPPGNRLLKWHLAGVADIDSRSFLDTLRSAYSKLSFTEWVHNRFENGKVFLGDFQFFESLEAFRRANYFHHGVMLIPLGAGLFYLPRFLRRYPDWMSIGWGIFLSLIFWITVLFEPGSTVIHQGSYATTLFIMAFLASASASESTWTYRLTLLLQFVAYTLCFLVP